MEQLRVFVTAVDAGGFSAAGRALGRAQSAISYGISNLEELLEVSLFDRQSHRPKLTSAGKTLLGDARAVLGQLDSLIARAQSIDAGVEAHVSLAVDTMFPEEDLYRILSSFKAKFPHVELNLYSESMSETIKLVVSGECDIGISLNIDSLPAGFHTDVVKTIEMVPVVASSHALAAQKGLLSSQALHGHTQIVLSNRKRNRSEVDHGVASGNTWRVVDLRTKKDLILAGFGFGSLPLHMIAEELAKGDLRRISASPWKQDSFRLPLCLVTAIDSRPGPATKWLVDTITSLQA